MITKTGDIFTAPLQQTEPPALGRDKSSVAMDGAIAKLLQENMELARNVGIYYRVGQLSERACDILATDLHVDWYDYDWTLEEKREAIRANVAIHRKMGTVYSVKRAISIVATGDSNVEEWFDYDGEPFRFRVTLTENDPENPSDLSKVIKAIQIYKPVRARLEGVVRQTDIDLDESQQTVYYGTALAGYSITPMPLDGMDPTNGVLDYFILDSDTLN